MTQPNRDTILNDLCDAALKLAASQPWDRIGLAALCRASGVGLAQCAGLRITKFDVVDGLERRLDQAMLDMVRDADQDEPVRDRLFEVVMARFDIMEADRSAWASLRQDARHDPFGRWGRLAARGRTAVWAMEAAGVPSTDLLAAAQIVGLSGLLRQCEAAWLDDGPDLAKTMSALDAGLRAGGEWTQRWQAVRRDGLKAVFAPLTPL